MITLTVANSNPSAGSGVKCKRGESAISTKPISLDELDFCVCKFECKYEELAFVNINDTAKKDENDF